MREIPARCPHCGDIIGAGWDDDDPDTCDHCGRDVDEVPA